MPPQVSQKISQKAEASGGSSVYQAAGDLYVVGEAPRPAPQALASLPPAPAALVGRDGETGELLGLLDPRGAGPSVAVITGTAGVGKTALALHAAHEATARGWFPGGALFAPLHGYDGEGEPSVEQVLAALLRAVGVPGEDVPAGFAERLGLFRSELSRRAAEHGPVLVLADDAGSSGPVGALVPAQPGHRLLVTSRRTLADLPARAVALGELDAASGAGLVTGTLRLVRPGDPRPAAEPEAVDALVAACGRLPLALRVSAALLASDPGLPVAALVADLADARGRLSQLVYDDGDGGEDGSDGNGPGGPLAVRAAFELSYRRLRPELARTFRLLAVDPGSDLSTAAAAALTGGTLRGARRSLAGLAAHSLLAEQPVGGDRWRMHDLIRLYGAELSAAEPEERQAALARLLGHYGATAAAAGSHIRRARSGENPADDDEGRFRGREDALAWFDEERVNLVASVPLALSAGLLRDATGLGSCVTEYLHERHHDEEAVVTARAVLEAARLLEDRDAEVSALCNLAVSLRAVHRLEDAVRTYRDALEIHRELRNGVKQTTASNNLGLVLLDLHRFDEAVEVLTGAVELCSDDPRMRAVVLNSLGRVLAAADRTGDAILAYEEAVGLHREAGNRPREADVLNNLGRLCRNNRWFDQAVQLHTRALEIYREVGDQVGEGYALSSLGLVLTLTERHEEAIEAHTLDVELCREQHHRHGEAQALSNLAQALVGAGRHLEAVGHAERAVALFRALGYRRGEGVALSHLGTALVFSGRLAEGIEAHETDLRLATEDDDRKGRASAWQSLGTAYRIAGRHAESIRAYRLAFELFGEAGDIHSTAGALVNLGHVLTKAGRPASAVEFHARAAELFHALGDPESAARAEAGRAAAQAATAEQGGTDPEDAAAPDGAPDAEGAPDG